MHTLKLFLQITASFIVLLSIPQVQASNTQQQMTLFEKRTARIMLEANRLSQKHFELVEKVNRTLEKTKSAKGIFTSGLLDEMADAMDQSLANTQAYLTEFEVFINSIDTESPCYLPEGITNLENIVAEKQAVADAIRTVSGETPDEQEAVVTVLNITVQDMQAAILPQSFELFKMCLIADAFGLKKSEIAQKEKEKLEKQALVESQKPKYTESFKESFSLYPDEELSLHRFLPIYIEEKSQLSEIVFSNGVNYDKDFNIILPDSIQSDVTQAFNFQITGRVQNEDTIYDLQIQVNRLSFTPLNNLSFSNPDIKKCIFEIANNLKVKYAEKVSQFICQIPENSVVNIKEVSELSNIETFYLTGGRINDFENFNLFDELNHFQFKSVSLNSFAKLNKNHSERPLFVLENTKIDDWNSITNLNGASIALPGFKTCNLLQKLDLLDGVFVVYQGMDSYKQLEVMEAAEQSSNSKIIQTSCTLRS